MPASPALPNGFVAALLLLGGVWATATPAPTPAFEDVAQRAGLIFQHQSGASGDEHLPEIMGPGAALVDIDNDGDLDVYLVQGGTFGPGGTPGPARALGGLFRNDLRSDARSLPTLTDITKAAGIGPGGYAMGVAVGDYDNDGWIDVFETGYGSTRLLRNVEGRRFEDVTVKAGVGDSTLSVSATFVDYDRDGWLDLFLTRYVRYSDVRCVLPSGRRDYCGPKSFPALTDRLLHNAGGTFVDVSHLLVGGRAAAGLGVVSADVNGDGFADLYVANDGADNHLWISQAGKSFREDGLLAGVALNAAGLAEAGMGVDAGDVDGDGDVDLFVTNLTGETNTLYVNDGRFFEDRTIDAGLSAPSLPLTGFGTRFVDLDNDGWLDLPVVNGAVHVTDATPSPATPSQLGQPKLLFRNVGAGRFADITPSAGDAFATHTTSRGLAVGDIDNDGDPDLLVANDDGTPQLLLNREGDDVTWVGLRLVTRDGKRDATGAVATLVRAGRPPLVRYVHTDGSYASASDPRLLFGLGDHPTIDRLEVRWPDGSREVFPPPATGRYSTLRQGTGATTGAR